MITFEFKINKSFLNYPSHPITVPKMFNEWFLDEPLGARALISCPYGSMDCVVYPGEAGWGTYYQIRVTSRETFDPLSKFLLGQRVMVEIKRFPEITEIWLNPIYK